MATPFMSEIKLMAFNFAPQGWAACNGQFMPINQNQALFSLLGTTYGGNGQTTFALPNLQGRVPIHRGNGHILGEAAGATATTVTIAQLPTHTHVLSGSNSLPETNVPTGAALALMSNAYAAPNNLVAMGPTAVGNAGGSQPHTNMQPYLALNFCIALQGIYPSQN
ncbi:MAG TPA: tail fiber protein [Patescibacteria group bacterium]|nr:tail fiber protein [Patescibacteria group bacterium]